MLFHLAATQIPTRTLFIARGCAFVTVSGGERIDLSTKGTLRRILRAIVEMHREAPRRGLTVRQVFEAGWSEDVANPDALAGRVYSAFSKLRRLGLGDLIVRTEAGYMLDPRCCVIEELGRESPPIIQNADEATRLAS